ncbi:D-alanyl-D-alanine carboxypeptidase [Escherichia coli]
MTQCFSAPPAAAIVDRNCVSALALGVPNPRDVALYAWHLLTLYDVRQVRTLPRGSAEAQYCELDVVPGDLNRFTLTGCLPQRSEPLPLAFAIPGRPAVPGRGAAGG